MSELKPCPFCGGEAFLDECPNCGELNIIVNHADDCWVLEYQSCYDIPANEREQYIAIWNHRAERACHDTGESRWFCCSECGCGINDIYLNDEARYGVDARLLGNGDDEFPYYCPYCGAKVVE